MIVPVDTGPATLDGVDDVALQHFRLLRPVLEDAVPLCALSRMSGVPEPTLRRWLARYRREGLSGLRRRTRSDQGGRRCMSPELVAVIEGLALQRPRRSAAAIHRLVREMTEREGQSSPSYATVHAVVTALD
ncbi:MAG TPA: helix-turn-helix domain-containing protein, partial [Rhodopila sp.]|nr:helix-turn-helix domain-containing protein [Rhodopila sp.]